MRDLVSAVLAFNMHSPGEPLQISFPLFTDSKVSERGVLGPCVRVTGPAEKLYVLTLRYEVSAHLRAGRAMTLVRDRPVIEAGRNERFALVGIRRSAQDEGHRRRGAAARAVGPLALDRNRRQSRDRRARRSRVHLARRERRRDGRQRRSPRVFRAEDGSRDEVACGPACRWEMTA